jgi:hypothetical protein
MTLDNDLLGTVPCPECGQLVMCAWDAGMQSVALDRYPRLGGEWAVTVDPNHIPWCAPVPDGQLTFDDVHYSLHVCPLAEVIPFTARAESRPVERVRRRA